MPLQSSPSVTLYTLGRGILYIGAWGGEPNLPVAPTQMAGMTDMGVCNSFMLEVTEEKLDHFSRRSRVRLKDRIATIEVGYKVTFTLDELAVTNLQMYLRGTQVSSKISAHRNTTAEYAIVFQSDNAFGPNERWQFWRVRIIPAGTLGLVADDWQVMSFAGEGLADIANHASTPFFDVQLQTTTTTTAP